MNVQTILDGKGHHVHSVTTDQTVSAVVEFLGKHKIGAVLVMAKGQIAGIVSERDIVRVLGERGAAVLETPLSEVMTRKVVCCRASDSVGAIMEKMTAGKFRHLPVLEGGEVVGIISIGDVVKSRIKEFEHEQEVLQDYIKTA